ncbi:unnamed protein product, partial [Scytosiphon promiscuus]
MNAGRMGCLLFGLPGRYIAVEPVLSSTTTQHEHASTYMYQYATVCELVSRNLFALTVEKHQGWQGRSGKKRAIAVHHSGRHPSFQSWGACRTDGGRGQGANKIEGVHG